MKIFKVRWWIPVSLTLACAAAWLVVQHRSAMQTLNYEHSTGLGVAVPSFDLLAKILPSTPQTRYEPLARQRRVREMPGMGVAGGVPEASESYRAIAEDAFAEAARDRLSTFSIDVDTASYTNIRRYLRDGQRPPADAVRIEEMLNYFTYSYPDPAGPHPFSVTTEIAACPWTPANRLVRIGLKSKPIAARDLPPSNLTFLIDVSGSMESPERLPLVKRSFAMLVEQLRPQDTVAVTVYAGNAGLVLPPTPGSQKTTILDALERLEAGGSTAGGAGIRQAYATARQMYRADANNRVILATDGDFNVGVSSPEELIKLIESERGRGIYLTALGFGMGDMKDATLQSLANHGNGQHAYVDSDLEARRMFVEQIGATLQTVAKDVKLQVDFNPARVRSYRLIGYEKRKLTAEEFRDDRKDAGDLGAGHTVTALYEIVPEGGGAIGEDAFRVAIRYKDPRSDQATEMTVNATPETATPSADFRFAAAVAEFGMVLRDSAHKGGATLESALRLASENVKGDDRRAGLAKLIDQARVQVTAKAGYNGAQ